MNFEYLTILTTLILVSFSIKHKFSIALFNTKKQAILFWSIMYAVGIAWDSYAILRGHWFYPKNGVIGIFVGPMPIEDYLFIFVATFFGLITYKAIRKLSGDESMKQ